MPGSLRPGLRDQMAHRALQPLAAGIAAKIDLDERQPCEKQLVRIAFATEIAADEPGCFAAAAQAHRRPLARQVTAELTRRCR